MKIGRINPLVSIIVPVYKVEQYLENCLNSLLNQTYSNWEGILVDDGSPDTSGEICDEYAKRDCRFKVIHKKNGGLSSARNAGLKHSNGAYIFYLDSDDFLHKNALADLTKIALEKNAEIVQCDFTRGTLTEFPEINNPEIITLYNNHTLFTSFSARIITCGKLYKRSVIGDIIFPEGLINEDDFTTWKFYYKAKSIAITSMPYYYYTCNPNSIMSQKTKRPNFKYFDAYRERIKFFKEKNEPDLEAVSHIQWMKSLVMTFSNDNLTEGQRTEVLETFKDNYISLKRLSFPTPSKLSVIFKAFNIFPYLVSKAVVKMHNR